MRDKPKRKRESVAKSKKNKAKLSAALTELEKTNKGLHIPHWDTTLGEALDAVNHPAHYTQHPSGVECIDITEHMPFNIGNIIKYAWRAGLKSETSAKEDLEKASWYVRREIERLEKLGQ